jgi:glycosyltransferase involved in cell wall biosynthesis
MKQPLVSVIVPTYNSASYLALCLDSINKQSYRNIELVVVDNNSKDETFTIAKKFTKKVFNKGPERSAQRNFGVKKSKGKYLLIIDSDMVLTANVVKECVAVFEDNKEIKALVIPEESFGEGFWSECKALERSFYKGISWMEAARCFKREVFEEMGGYNEKNTGTEDYDLPLRIKSEHGLNSISRIKALIRHNEQKISLLRTCKKKFYYAQGLDVYKTVPANKDTFSKQSSILNRYMLFFSDPVKLFKNPVVGFGMLFMKTSEFFAGGLGYIYAKQFRRNK